MTAKGVNLKGQLPASNRIRMNLRKLPLQNPPWNQASCFPPLVSCPGRTSLIGHLHCLYLRSASGEPNKTCGGLIEFFRYEEGI